MEWLKVQGVVASLAVWAHGASENWECKTWSKRTYMTGLPFRPCRFKICRYNERMESVEL